MWADGSAVTEVVTGRARYGIDVQMGPDGAIYIADWYNPIIQHGEVDFRDPRRDQERGRVIGVVQSVGHERHAARDAGQELQAHLAKHLSKIEQPDRIEVRDSLPKTQVGKLSKKDLVEQEAELIAGAAQ